MLRFLLILSGLALVIVGYAKRHSFRRFWYILRTGDENPDWEKLGGDYFIAPWERRGTRQSPSPEEEKFN